MQVFENGRIDHTMFVQLSLLRGNLIYLTMNCYEYNLVSQLIMCLPYYCYWHERKGYKCTSFKVAQVENLKILKKALGVFSGEKLPYQCHFADCSFLHANSCREHKLITACCCDKLLLVNTWLRYQRHQKYNRKKRHEVAIMKRTFIWEE